MRNPYISMGRPLPTVEYHMGARSLYFLWTKFEKNDEVRHNNITTQKAGLLAVATDFDLWTPFYSQGGGLIRETKVPTQKFELKNAGGLVH